MAFDHQELQRALYERLTAALGTMPVYSFPPQQPDYPFVRIDGITAADAGTKDVDFDEVNVTISAFYRDTSSTGALSTTLKTISAALHNQEAALTMTGQKAILFRRVSQNVFQRGDDDGDYLFGMLRFRSLIQET